MAKRIFELPQTKRGNFEIRGIINGTESDRFFTEKKTRTGGDFANVNFGVEYDAGSTIYMTLNGMTRDKVYFSKRVDGGKTETKEVIWANRNKPQGDGWRLIGINLGITKIQDKDGKIVNDKKTMTEYDATKYIRDNLKDDSSVFIKGNIEYDSYTDKDGNIRRSVKYVPTQVSLCAKDIDFDEFDGETKKPKHAFTQTIIFTGIDKERDDNEKETGRYVVNAKVVNYNNIQDVEYIISDSKLANLFRKNLKVYNAIEVFGRIQVTHSIESVSDNDGWGEANEMKRVNAPTKVELLVTGADPHTIDKETYNAKNIEDAMKQIKASQRAKESFGESKTTNDVDDWSTDDDIDDEDDPW